MSHNEAVFMFSDSHTNILNINIKDVAGDEFTDSLQTEKLELSCRILFKTSDINMEAGSIGRFQGHKGAVWRWTSTRMLARRPPGRRTFCQGVGRTCCLVRRSSRCSTNILSLSRALLSPPAVTIRFSGSLVIFCENK